MAFSKVIKGTAAYSIVQLVARSVSFLYLPLFTRYLTAGDYGALELLSTTQSIVALLLGNRVGQAVLYFHADAKDEAERNRYLASGYLLSFLAGAVSLAAALFAAPSITNWLFDGKQSYLLLVQLSLVATALQFPLEIGYCCLRAADRQVQFVSAQLAGTFLTALVAAVGLAAFQLGPLAIPVSALSAAAAITFWLTWAILRDTGFGFHPRHAGEMLRYAAPLTAASFSEFVMHFGDRYILKAFTALSEIGVYSVAYRFGMLISQFQVPFFTFWNAQVHHIVRQESGAEIYWGLSRYFAVFFTSVAAVMILFMNPLLKVMTTPEFFGAAVYVPVLLLAYLLRGVAGYLRTIMLARNRAGAEAKANVTGTIVCLALYAALIPLWGVWGAVWATALAYAAVFALSWKIVTKEMGKAPEVRPLLGLLASLSMAAAMAFATVDLSIPRQIALGAVGSLVYLGSLLIFGVIRNHEAAYLLTWIRERWGSRRPPRREE